MDGHSGPFYAVARNMHDAKFSKDNCRRYFHAAHDYRVELDDWVRT